MTKKWDKRYLKLAEHISEWSKDPSSKIGAVAVGEVGQILATGYNGFPREIKDTDKRLTDRQKKYDLIVHAEMNCIYNAVYNGLSLKGATIYVHGLPACNECAKGLIQVGIKRVVVPYYSGIAGNWSDSFDKTIKMFKEAKVKLDVIEL